MKIAAQTSNLPVEDRRAMVQAAWEGLKRKPRAQAPVWERTPQQAPAWRKRSGGESLQGMVFPGGRLATREVQSHETRHRYDSLGRLSRAVVRCVLVPKQWTAQSARTQCREGWLVYDLV